jgi:hypothetical protein
VHRSRSFFSPGMSPPFSKMIKANQAIRRARGREGAAAKI